MFRMSRVACECVYVLGCVRVCEWGGGRVYGCVCLCIGGYVRVRVFARVGVCV